MRIKHLDVWLLYLSNCLGLGYRYRVECDV